MFFSFSAEQYKCPLCTYKSATKDTFPAHFSEKHPDSPLDIITAYYNVDEIECKPTITSEISSFDTTPLWQRDKQRVRHIRGILFDESGKIPKKGPPIKLLTPTPSATATSSSTTTTVQNNLDRAIEAVVNASDYTTKKRKKEEKSFNEQKIEALDKQINEALNSIMSRKIGTGLEQPSIKKEEDEDEKKVVKKDSSDVIVIEEEDDGGEAESNEKMGTFGPFGEPLNNKYLCPLCASFKTRNCAMVKFHLYEELQYYR